MQLRINAARNCHQDNKKKLYYNLSDGEDFLNRVQKDITMNAEVEDNWECQYWTVFPAVQVVFSVA